jgi:CubicO group peptidase (beta-lactamase class C family)
VTRASGKSYLGPVLGWAALLVAALPAAAGFDPAALADLEAEIGGIVEASEVPGAAVALVGEPGSATWSAGFGRTEAAGGRPVTADTLFRANSVSKSLVALALLRLDEAGRIDLEAPLREVAPEIAFENRWEGSHPVRVVHLLEHTTGFDDLHLREYAFGPEDGGLREALAVNPAPRTARWPPGTRMAYNNGGYAVAAYLVEKASGERWEAYAEREVLRPLGMESSGFGLERIDRGRLAGETEPYPLLVRPAGGLITSADDLAALVRGLVRGGDPVVSERSVRRMRRPRTTEAARAGLAVGYGLGSYTAAGETWLWHGHAGGTPTAFARYAVQPELGVGYALLMNGADGDARERLEAAIQRFLVAGRPAPAAPGPEALVEGASPEAYAGTYRQSTSSWSLTAGVERLFDVQRVTATEDGRLALSPLLGGEATVLVPAGGDLFRRGGEAWPSAVFLRAEPEDRATGLRTWDPENLRAGNHQRVSALRAWLPLAGFLLALVLVVTALLALPVRAVGSRLRKSPTRRGRWERALPTLAVLSLVGAIAALVFGVSGEDGLLVLGRPGLPAIAFFVLTWAFALLSPAALAVTAHALLRRRSPGWPTRLARLHALLVALACTTLAIHLATWGLIGLRTWAW